MYHKVRLEDALASLPPEWPHDPLPSIRAALSATGEKLVVVDDDPIGMQAVHDVSVLLDWSRETIERELESDVPALFMVTNSRGMPTDRARDANLRVGELLSQVEQAGTRRFSVVSRWDSTLRGHFPAEVEALDEALGGGFDAWILVPFFFEGGRYTIDDVHHVADGGWLTPVGETEFARDPAFAYRSSDLKRWVEEVTGGQVSSGDVASISVHDIRLGGPDNVAEMLSGLNGRTLCVVNAASMRDMDVFALATLIAERAGKRFLYRSAASFIRSRLGQAARPLLTASVLAADSPAGTLIIAGSHVPRTTSQLEFLLDGTAVTGIEADVHSLLGDRAPREVNRIASEASLLLADGRDVAVITSRETVLADTAEENMGIGQRISDGLVAIVQSITVTPRAVISKGGMTTYNVARKALRVTQARVIGQVLPGVPVLRLGPDSLLPEGILVVFPGNVGEVDALARALSKLCPVQPESVLC